MTNEIYIAIGIILGLVVGLLIGRAGRLERDERIKTLEKELDIKRTDYDAQE